MNARKKSTLIRLVILVVLGVLLAGCASDNIENSLGNSTENIPEDRLELNTKEEDIDIIISDNAVSNCTFYSLDDKQYSLHELLGKPVVLHFWGPWCEPCMEEMYIYEEVYKLYKNDVNFIMLCTRSDKEEYRLEEIDYEYSFDIFYNKDNTVVQQYDIISIPLTYFINSEGELVSTIELKTSKEELISHLEKLVNEGN